MATGMTSWGQRKALGKRYAVDPALLLEQERLQNEYNLAPSREARALQADQFNRQLAFNAEQADQNRSDAAKSGMMGTVGGIATNAAILRAMTMEKGQPFFGGLFGKGSGAVTSGGYNGVAMNASGFATPTQEAAIQTATNAGTYSPTTGGINYVKPATIDAALTSSEVGGGVGTATGATGTGMASTGSGFSVGSVAGPVAIIGGALAAKNQWGGKDIPWDEKTTMQKATTAPGTAGALLPLAVGDKIFGGDSVFGKAYKEMARIEEQVMKPIEAVLDWVGGWF